MSSNFLKTKLQEIHRLTPAHKIGLDKLHLYDVEDLLRYIPLRYSSFDAVDSLQNINTDTSVTLHGQLTHIDVKKSWTSKMPMTEGMFSDGVNSVKVLWFNQPYIGKMYPAGTLVTIKGKPENKNGSFVFLNPSVEKIQKLPEQSNTLFSTDSTSEYSSKKISDTLLPIYPETKGVSSLFLLELVKKIIHNPEFKNVPDPLPLWIREQLSLPVLTDAILYTHIPRDEKLTISAKKRFLFEEMMYIQLRIEIERAKAKGSVSYKIADVDTDAFFALHDFTPTRAQNSALSSILSDMNGTIPMQRLLEGDVGSGKTLVAAAASYATILSKRDSKKYGTPLQVAYLAPTEVLAKQQFESMIGFLAHTGIEIGYISGTTALKFPSKTDPENYTKVSKPQMKKWIEEGKISMLVGTHAITKKTIEFRDLALIIIDEQHRFGVNSRRELAHKRGDKRPEIPHLLSMTATPIPRTLALALFGDLDLTIIDELPKGRKPIATKLVKTKDRTAVYAEIKKQVADGRQVYVICTRIEKTQDEIDTGTLNKKTVEDEVLALQKTFPDFSIVGMHSKLKPDVKDSIMDDFKENRIQILVSTSVVEVGVNVPNATLMVIEDADRFGLSQLHQLRGRIGRGEHASTCYLFTQSTNEKTLQRLNSFSKTTSGFELAEIDLAERGPGSLISKSQSGASDMAMEAMRNLKLVEMAKKYAREIVTNDIDLVNFPELRERVIILENLHME